MSSLDTLARRASSALHSEVATIPVPDFDLRGARRRQVRRTVRTAAVMTAAGVIAIAIPVWIAGSPDDPAPVTVPEPIPTVPGTVPEARAEGELTVETSVGTWRWVREDEPSGDTAFGQDPWRELPDPPVPSIEEVVWPQLRPIRGFEHRAPVGGVPVSSGGVTVTPAIVLGHIDWNRFYTNDDGWVEGRWRPQDEDCNAPDVCPMTTATLEIVRTRLEECGVECVTYSYGGVLDVLVATIVPGDPDAVEFRDEDTGELVLRLEATDEVTAAQLMRAGQACADSMECGPGMWSWELHVDGVGWVDPPWSVNDDVILWPGVQVAATADGFLVVVVEGPRSSAALHAWSSVDGVDWREVAPPYPLGDLGAFGHPLVIIGEGVVGAVPSQIPGEPQEEPRVARLVDGRFVDFDLDLSPIGYGRGSETVDLAPAPWGWIATTGPGRCRAWVSTDGTEWEEIATPDGTDVAEVVDVHTWTTLDDGGAFTNDPVPTPSDSAPATVSGSSCALGDDERVDLEIQHDVTGTGTSDTSPDFYLSWWAGGFADPEGDGS